MPSITGELLKVSFAILICASGAPLKMSTTTTTPIARKVCFDDSTLEEKNSTIKRPIPLCTLVQMSWQQRYDIDNDDIELDEDEDFLELI